MFLAGLAWLFLVVPAGYIPAGRAVPDACLCLLPALVTTRPVERLPALAVALPGVLAVGAALAMSTDAAGWGQPRFADYFLYAALTGVVAAAYARTPQRRLTLALAVCAAGILVVAYGAGVWARGGDPNARLLSPIGWHNQMAAFLLAPAILGIALSATRRGGARAVGALSAALTGAGIVLTTSRAGLVLLVVGWLAVGALLRKRGARRADLLVWASAPVAVVAVTALVVSPLVFPHGSYHWPLISGTGGRGVNTLSGSSTARVAYARAAMIAWSHAPLVGQGFGSFSHTAARALPRHPDYAVVYNVWIDALTSGGLLFGIPVIFGTLAPVLLALRGTWRARWWSDANGALSSAAALAATLLLAHAAFDVDIDYPACAGMLGVMLGFAWACSATHRAEPSVPSRRWAAAGTASLVLAALTCYTFGILG